MLLGLTLNWLNILLALQTCITCLAPATCSELPGYLKGISRWISSKQEAWYSLTQANKQTKNPPNSPHLPTQESKPAIAQWLMSKLMKVNCYQLQNVLAPWSWPPQPPELWEWNFCSVSIKTKLSPLSFTLDYLSHTHSRPLLILSPLLSSSVKLHVMSWCQLDRT